MTEAPETPNAKQVKEGGSLLSELTGLVMPDDGRFFCSECGDFASSDEDGCCYRCGRDLEIKGVNIIKKVTMLTDALKEAYEMRRALCLHSDDSDQPKDPVEWDKSLQRWKTALEA